MKNKNFPDVELCRLIPQGKLEQTEFLISETKEIVKRNCDCYEKVKITSDTKDYSGKWYPCPLVSESCKEFMTAMMSCEASFDADICVNADNALAELLCLWKVKNIPNKYLCYNNEDFLR